MPADPPVDESQAAFNPYAPPSADLREPSVGASQAVDPEVIAIRRTFIGRERAIKRVAWINLVFAMIWLPVVGVSLFMLAVVGLKGFGFELRGFTEPPAHLQGWGLLFATVFHSVCFVLYLALLFGLRGLRTWARWTMVGLVLTVLFVFLVGYSISFSAPPWVFVALLAAALFVAVVLYVLISPPSGRVFSRGYRQVVAQTRGMRFNSPANS